MTESCLVVDSLIEASPESTWARASRRVFSFPAMLAATLVVLTVLTVRSRFNDPDMWWHLKTGEIIWNTHSIPRTDLFSYTTNNHAWTDHEWLSQLTIYAAWQWGGHPGLMLWLCSLGSLLLIAQYVLCSLYSGNAKVALLGALVTWLFATIGLAIRPHIIGYLLLTCELLIVHLARSRNVRWFWALPPLFAVWVNCHGSFIFGLMVLSVFLSCSHIELRLGSLVSHKWDRSQRRTLAVAFALSMGALFVNPIGSELVTYPLNLILNQPTNLSSVAEWQSLALDDVRGLALLGITGLIMLKSVTRSAEIRLEELLLVGLGLGMAVRHQRMLFVFGVLAAPVLCRLLSNAWDRYDSARDRRTPNAVMLLIMASIVLLGFPNSSELDAQVKKDSPVKAVQFINRAALSGRMLNEYGYGGYLIWAAPQHKVFVDGRTDIFEWTGVLKEFGAWALLQTDPRALLDKYKIDFCLLNRESPMSHVLPLLPGWTLIYSDDLSVIFAKSARTQQKDNRLRKTDPLMSSVVGGRLYPTLP